MPNFRNRLSGSLLFLGVLGFTNPDSPAVAAPAQETEQKIVLTITGDLIGRIESLDEDSDPAVVISSYYALLPEKVHSKAETLRRELSSLVPDYEVAFAAADTAELNQVMEDIDMSWAAIRTIHAREFTPEAVAILHAAFARAYPAIVPGAPKRAE